MTRFQKLKHEARRAEQRSNWQRAIELYREAIRLDEQTGGSASDIGLYNRVGDLLLRLGDAPSAVEYYEQAIERYSTHDLKTSAIALCNKIRRIAPDHDDVHRKLGRLHASTGLTAEARSAFLEYIDRKQRQESFEEALEAVQEYVDLTGDEEFRVPFSERLQEAGMVAAAVAQLHLVFSARVSLGRDAEAIRQRIIDLDPESDPTSERAPGPEPARADRPRPAAEARGAEEPAGAVPSSGTHVELGRLVAAALHGESERPAIDPEVRATSPAAASPGEPKRLIRPALAELDFHELSAILSRFQSQVKDIVAESDHAGHYDLGVAYMGMGLLGEAIGEFQHAMQSPAHLAAAHARIGQCLAESSGRTAGAVSAASDVIGGASGLELMRLAGEISAGHAPAATAPPVEGSSPDASAAEDGDAMSSLLFKARLAQYRIREAQSEGRTDHEAHLELGLAYRQMGLMSEAARELATASTGPRSVAGRALDDLASIAQDSQWESEQRLAAFRTLFRAGRTGDALRGAKALHRSLEDHHPLAAETLSLITEIDPGAVSETAPEADLRGHSVIGDADTGEGAEVAEPPRSALDELDGILHELVEGMAGPPGDEPSGAARSRPPGHRPADLDPDLLVAEARRSLDAGRPEEAAADLYRALEPYDRQRQVSKAAEVIELLLRIDPDDVVLHHQRVEYAIMMNRRAALVDAYLGLASCLRRQGAPRAARSAYGRVLDIDPANAAAGTGIAELDAEELEREAQGRAARSSRAAGEPHARVRPEPPGGPDAGSGDSGAGGSDSARVFDAMLTQLQEELPEDAVDPDHTSHYELAVAFRQMEMWEEAVRELQIAMRGLQDPLPAYELLGECLLALGRSGVARRVLARAVDGSAPDEKLTGVLYLLGVACHEAGEPEAAREYFERVCAVDIGYRDAAHRLSQLSR